MHVGIWNYIVYFLAAFALAFIGQRYLSDRAKHERDAYDRSIAGTARVLQVGRTTRSRSFGTLVMDLRIQVHRPGLEPYELDTIWSVQAGSESRMQAGQTFAIRVDPQDPQRIYSGETWAQKLGVSKMLDPLR